MRRRARSLSDGFNGDRLLVDVARPMMLASTEQHGWPLSLSTPAGDRFFVRFTTDHTTTRTLKRYRGGFYAPLLTAAAGLICLANQSEPVRGTLIAELRKAPHPQVPLARDAQLLGQLLEKMRRDDFAEFEFPGERDVNLAIPLRYHGALLGALTMRSMRVAVGE